MVFSDYASSFFPSANLFLRPCQLFYPFSEIFARFAVFQPDICTIHAFFRRNRASLDSCRLQSCKYAGEPRASVAIVVW